jgi:hypothetical protein
LNIETLFWSLLIGAVWLAALRAPDGDGAGSDVSPDVLEDEDHRLWYAADLRNRIDRDR